MSVPLLAQWSIGGEPQSFALPELKTSDPTPHLTAIPDLEVLASQDELDRIDNVPPRFGFPFKANIDLQASGVWTEIEGGAIWRVAIESPGAQTINLNYSDFYMPHGATFHIYAADKSSVIGAFTEVNNKKNGQFATGLLKSDKIVLEYFEPEGVHGQGRIVVSEIIYGYRTLAYLDNALKGYEDSGSCMVNVNCAEGDNWQAHKKGVAMIMTAGNFRFCTGSLINNSAGNCQALFLTAEHCMGQQTDAQIGNSIFVFNYETPDCENPDDEPSVTQNVQGCQILSTGATSDFTLWELEENPALAPNIPGGVYFAGWDRNNSAADRAVAIHHPEGDVKKISIDNQAPQSSQWQGNPAGTHWLVRWNEGVTASGSSGGPLYNENGLIVGQLTGGASTCVSPNAADLYGKMSWNWDSNEDDADFGLREFLDVNDENLFTLEGRACGEFAFDGSLEVLEPAGEPCDEVIPVVRVRNNGATAFNLIGVQLKLNGELLQNKVFTDELTSFSTADITFDAFPAPAGTDNVLLACFININGSSDEDPSNDCATVFIGCEDGGDVGIEELAAVQVYPNPSEGQLYISGITERTLVSLFTADGRLIYEQQLRDDLSLDLSAYNNGLYLLRMQQGGSVLTQKVGLLK